MNLRVTLSGMAGPHSLDMNCEYQAKEKKRDLTQSYDKCPIPRKSKNQHDNNKMPSKTSITQRLRTDLGRLVRVNTGVVKPVYGHQTFPLTTTAV